MHRQTTTTTIILLLILAFLCFQTQALSPLPTKSFRNNFILNAHENSTGRVQLKKDSNSSYFYVEADFLDAEPSKASSQTTSNNSNPLTITDTVKMMVSIVSMETLVATNCLGFNYYDCSKYNCTIKGSKYDIDYPTFTASGAALIQSYVYLDYQYWMIDDGFLYIADSCQTGDTSSDLGKDRYGVLGLGAGMVSEYNFWYPPVFSVLINSNLTGGELLFMKDDNFNQSSNPLHTFFVNDTWQIPTRSSDKIKISSSSIDLNNCNIMFDINSDAIGLPNDIYTTVLSYFTSDQTVSCGSDNYKPYCYTAKKLEDLPDIILSVNSSQIIIPSKIYATFDNTTSGDKTFFYFNFKATSPVLSDHSYVSPSFKNSIILDAHFMSYYYTIFCGRNEPKRIYLYSTSNTPSQPGSYAKWIVLGALAVIVVVGIWFWTQKKRATTAKNRATAATMNTTTDGNTTQAPIVHNQYAPPAPVVDTRERAKW